MADAAGGQYPWYSVVSGRSLEQGDILFECPVFLIPPDAIRQPGQHAIAVDRQNVIVMTQSCDLAIRPDGSCNTDDVILAAVFFKQELSDNKTFGNKGGWNSAKKGRFPSCHVLNRCTIEEYESDFMLVDLRRVYSLSIDTVRQVAEEQGDRIRLMPPYREHLSQAFARFFMRVGLPVDIPDFK
ncbi:MAG: hypothetical protein ACC628_02755 [Pirellulaceae bacterium]